MKKKFIAGILLSACLILSGCGHDHTWQAATCIAPKICPECGTTEGEPLGHSWIDATCIDAKICNICLQTMGQPLGHSWEDASCTAPKTCKLCGVSEGDPLEHNWLDATCTTAKTCAVCGVTKGETLEHTWIPATCTQPESCSICGTTQGKSLGHTFTNWKLDKKSTCTEPGVETSTCDVCGESGSRETELAEHTPGQWTVSKIATPNDTGIKVKKCTKCETVTETTKYALTENEIKQYYNKEYKSISYENLSRYPDDYKGEKVKFTGRVVQVCSEAKSALYYSTYRVATSGRYDNVVYIYVDNYGSGRRILEGDQITFYGTYDGLYTYTTVMGASVTIPSVKVDYVI